MVVFSKWQSFWTLLCVALGVYLLLPNFIGEERRENLPFFVPKQALTLGLDLRGGSYLLLEADTDVIVGDRLRILRDDVRQSFRSRDKGRIAFRNLESTAEGVRVEVVRVAEYAQAEKRLSALTTAGQLLPTGLVQRDYELSNPQEGEYVLSMLPSARRRLVDEAMGDIIEIIRRRIDPSGAKEPSVQRQGQGRIVLQVPGDDNPEALKQIIGRTGKLTFHPVDEALSDDPARSENLPPGRTLLPSMRGFTTLIIDDEPIVTGDMVGNASAALSADEGGYEIRLNFDRTGTRRFANFTKDNVGRRFAIVLDSTIIVAPVVISPIVTGSSRITGSFSAEEASELAILIRSGALPAPLTTLEQRSIGPDLGADSVRAGTYALFLALFCVMLFMFLSYGLFGAIADVALLSNLAMIFGLLSFFGATLTLPGIAGIVLTVGMAVDANVLIFERIREEIARGQRVFDALESGYRQARSAIIDANVTTFIAALIMLQLGAGPVRGFAVTLAIGVITSVFSAYVLTRMFIGWHIARARPTTLEL